MNDIPNHPRHKGIPHPSPRIPTRHHINMPLQHEQGPVPTLTQMPDQPPSLLTRSLGPGKLWMRTQGIQIHTPQINIEPKKLQPPSQQLLYLPLSRTTGHTRNGDELHQRTPDSSLINGIEHGSFMIEQQASLPGSRT